MPIPRAAFSSFTAQRHPKLLGAMGRPIPRPASGFGTQQQAQPLGRNWRPGFGASALSPQDAALLAARNQAAATAQAATQRTAAAAPAQPGSQIEGWDMLQRNFYPTGNPQDLLAQMQRFQSEYAGSYEDAKRANEKRYENILAGYGSRESDVMGALSGYGASQAADIQSSAQAAQGSAMQDLVSRGLMGTTVAPSLKAGFAGQTARSLTDLQGQLALMRAQTLGGLRGDKLAFQERRTDAYPDPNLWTGYMSAFGQGAGARGTFPWAQLR